MNTLKHGAKACMLAILILLGMSSCKNEAQEVAFELEGSWTGVVESYTYSRYGKQNYYLTWYFQRYNNDDFDIRNSTSGWGYEIAYDSGARFEHYTKTQIYFQIDGYPNPVITISYPDGRYNSIIIHNYNLGNGKFEGWLNDGGSSDKWFSFQREGITPDSWR